MCSCLFAKNTYVVASISVVLVTCYYYFLYPIEPAPCLALHQPRLPEGAESRQQYASIVPFDQFATHFNWAANDVIVFLHIQKTGGTRFDEHLTRDVAHHECECNNWRNCECNRPVGGQGGQPMSGRGGSWLFSRFSTEKWPCGVHADWTELTNCVPSYFDKEEGFNHDRRFWYVTVLREPVQRFVSEWKHVVRGASWRSSVHLCNGRPPTQEELPPCYQGDSWGGEVSLEDFLACDSNLAFNRQTRMLADLSVVDCYNTTSMPAMIRDAKLLQSAKSNLLQLAWFGISSRHGESQKLFQHTFNVTFTHDLESRSTQSENTEISRENLITIARKNSLDIELFQFASKLFNDRLALLSNPDKL